MWQRGAKNQRPGSQPQYDDVRYVFCFLADVSSPAGCYLKALLAIALQRVLCPLVYP